MQPTVRRAEKSDMPAVARLAALLVRMHHALDPQRFLLQEPVEPGYEWWLTKELSNEKAVILVAEDEAAGGGARSIVGYAYGRLEPRDWNALLDTFGALHDVYVADEARKRGVGAALVAAIAKELEALGAPRVVLSTATKNAAAQRLFAKMGFRPTMIEMTRELGGGGGEPR
jgi:ribosomal protein S18 acetylase RimI-like enzyme